MSLDAGRNGGPFCGCMGCLAMATVIIRHPKHGRRTVCDDHATGHDVVEVVRQ